MTAGQIIAFLFGTFIGGFLFYQGSYRLFVLYRLKKKGQYANGTVVRREKGDAYNTTVPFISFIDHVGNKVQGIAKNSIPTRGPSIRDVGDNVHIYYDTYKPDNFAIDAIVDKLVCFLIVVCGCTFLYAVVENLFKHFN